MRSARCLALLLPSLVACAATPPADPPANPTQVALPAEMPTPAAPPPPPLAWPRGPDCPATAAALAGLPAEARGRLEREGAPLALAVVDGGAFLTEGAALEAVTLDLPLPVAVGVEALRAYPCIVLLERSGSARAAPRRVTGHEVVRSTYRRSAVHAPNPEHVALKRRVRELERRRDSTRIVLTGDPGIDLIGLLAGGALGILGRAEREAEQAKAEEALDATPATIEQAVWEPYTYEVSITEAQRSGWLRAALLDQAAGRAWPLRREVLEARSFRVASGRRADDRELLESQGGAATSPAAVKAWEGGGLRPALSQLLSLLADTATAGPGEAGDVAALVGRWAAEPLPALAAVLDASAVAPAVARSAARASLVETVVGIDGARRYRLREPALGVGEGLSLGPEP